MTDFSPKDAEFRNKVQNSFDRMTAMTTLKASVQSIEAGQVSLTMPFSVQHQNQHQFMHAGIMTTVLDTACGYAALSLMPADYEVLTVEFKTNLLAPAKGSEFEFVARVVRPGRTLTVCDANAYALDSGEKTLIATMTATLMGVRA